METKIHASVMIEQPDQVFDKMNSKIPAVVKVEQPYQLFSKMDSQIPAIIKVEHPEVYIDYPGQDEHTSSESYPTVCTQVHAQMKCGNIDERLVKQELSDVLCEDKSQRSSQLVDSAACSTIQEMAWQNETKNVIKNDSNSSLKDENCHISENVSSAIETNNELFLTNEKYQLQNVGTPLKHTQVPAKPVNNICDYDSYPRRKQTEETPYMSDVSDSIANDCGACSAEAGCLEHHERTCAGEKLHICDVCGASFTLSHNLTHHKRMLTGDKLHICDVCDVSFTQSNSLTRHKRMPTGEKPYKCDDCGASFNQSGHLKNHKFVHTREKPYNCDDCGSSFAHFGSLNGHMRLHTGEKPYKCDDCGAAFNQSGHLKNHKFVHTGEKPYKCDVCGASFTQNYGLKYHKRTHTREKPYKCDDCGALFEKVGKLLYHKRIHKPRHTCDVCGASFTKGAQLKCHKRMHAGEKSDKCLYCTASVGEKSTCDSFTSFVKTWNLHAHDRKCYPMMIVARHLF